MAFRAVPIPGTDEGVEPSVVVLGDRLVVTAGIDDGGRADIGIALVHR